MTLKQMLDRKHIVFDVETFGLSGDTFAIGAVLGRFSVSDDGEHVVWTELLHVEATDWRTANKPWKYDIEDGYIRMGVPRTYSSLDVDAFEEEFNWLTENIPAQVFEERRLTGDLTIHELFASFAESHLTDGSAEWWAECPVPCEATFLRELAQRLGPPWGTPRVPPMRDVASLADPLGVGDERPDDLLPAHDPLNDARWSAERLRAAVQRLVRVKEHLR